MKIQINIGASLEFVAEVIGIVDCSAAFLVKSLGSFATMTRSKTEFGAAVVAAPGENGVPKLATDALAAE